MEITTEMLNLTNIEEYILEKALFEDADVENNDENDAQKKKEIHETVTLILDGGKDNDIKNLNLYKNLQLIINSLSYTQHDSKNAMLDWLKIFGRFVYICDSLNLGDDVTKTINNVVETMKALPLIMKKAQEDTNNKLSLNSLTLNLAKTVSERLKKILQLKATDEQEANRQKEELKRLFPNASKAIDLEYNKYKPSTNGNNQLKANQLQNTNNQQQNNNGGQQ